MNPPNDALFSSDLWQPALEKYADAAHLTVQLFDGDGRVVFGPIHPTPLFQLFSEKGYDPDIFTECVRRCFAQTDSRPPVVVSQFYGLAVIGTSLVLDGKIVGAAVGGYVFVDFSQVSEIHRLAHDAGIKFESLWEVARQQKPVPQRRLIVNGEVLQVLGDALMRETFRTLQRRQVEAALRESEERYRTLFELGPVAVYSVDSSGSIQNFNSRAAELWGRAPHLGDTDERFCGSSKLFRPDGSSMPHEQCPMAEVVSGKLPAVHDAELLIERPDGSRVTVIVNIRLLKNDRGEITGAVNCFYDITERKRSEEEREHLLVLEQQARQEAENANRVKDEFLAVVSHELRTPLTPILMWTSMLKSDSDPNDVPRAMEVIERNVMLQLRLIENLLDLSRIIKGKMNLELAEYDLAEILLSTVDSIQRDAEKKGISLTVAGAGHPLRVEADAGRLQQVFTNILYNAVKFTPPSGSIQVQFAGEGNNAVVRVRDTGEGIAPEFLPHVFEMFRQQETGVRRSHSGLGIGLALVKSLVDFHGGEISVKSEGQGCGTEVTVKLPRLSSVPETKIPPIPAARVQLSSPLRGLSILLVEDSDDSRKATELLLKRFGARVSAATNGLEALDAMAAADPDLILCDLAMPRMDGFEFMEKLRHLRGVPHPPVIAVSGRSTPADHKRTAAAGFAGHLNKPFDDTSLLSAIRNAHCRLVPERSAVIPV